MFSMRFRREYPLCGQRPPNAPPTNDSRCQAMNIVREASDVDHITPVKGPNDPLTFAESNLQSLCRRCHSAKTLRESRAS